MNVPLVDPLALIKPVIDSEPEEVADVLPSSFGWGLFEDLVKTLRTGDVVIFVGHGWVGSSVQKYVQKAWVHVGMVIVFEEYDMTLVWELQPSKSLEIKSDGKLNLNVQLTDINSKIRDGKYFRIAVRK